MEHFVDLSRCSASHLRKNEECDNVREDARCTKAVVEHLISMCRTDISSVITYKNPALMLQTLSICGTV